MDVRVEGQVVDAPEQGDVAAVLQKALSGKKFESAGGCACDRRGHGDFVRSFRRPFPPSVPTSLPCTPILPKA